jgi:hypothetical protein
MGQALANGEHLEAAQREVSKSSSTLYPKKDTVRVYYFSTQNEGTFSCVQKNKEHYS